MTRTTIHYEGKSFRAVSNSESGEVSSATIFRYHQKGNMFWAEYSGGEVLRGYMPGVAQPDGTLEFHYQHLNADIKVRIGKCRSTPEILTNGKIRLHEKWQWLDGDHQIGTSIVEEV